MDSGNGIWNLSHKFLGQKTSPAGSKEERDKKRKAKNKVQAFEYLGGVSVLEGIYIHELNLVNDHSRKVPLLSPLYKCNS